MPRRLPSPRVIPWMLLMEALMVAREHWSNLTPGERGHLAALVRKSRGRPGNLTQHERDDVRRIAGKLDLPGLGRNLAPFAGRVRGHKR